MLNKWIACMFMHIMCGKVQTNVTFKKNTCRYLFPLLTQCHTTRNPFSNNDPTVVPMLEPSRFFLTQRIWNTL